MSLQRLRLLTSISEAYPNIQYFEEFQSTKKYKNEDFELILKVGSYGYPLQYVRQSFPEITRQYLQIFKKNFGMTFEQYICQMQAQYYQQQLYLEQQQFLQQQQNIYQNQQAQPQKFTLEEVKNFINGFGKQNIKGVNEQLIKSVSAMNNWTITQQILQQKAQIQEFKEQPHKRYVRKKKLQINKSFQTYNNEKKEQAERKINFNLNLLTLQNLKGIQADLKPFLIHSKEFCQVLIQQIIQKAWQKPKYSSTYALLCKYFSNVPSSDFNFDIYGNSESKTDREKISKSPFKFFLIEKVQHTFDRKHENLQFKSEEQKQNYLKVIKKEIIGNVKFIAELILNKVLKKRIVKYCTTQLIITFLTNHYYYVDTNKFEYSFYDYYMEAVIEFIQSLSEKFESLDDQKQKKQENYGQKKYTYDQVLKIVDNLISFKKAPLEQYPEFEDISTNECFKLFRYIDEKILSKQNKRLSLSLKNLEKKRGNGWQLNHLQIEKSEEIKNDQKISEKTKISEKLRKYEAKF